MPDHIRVYGVIFADFPAGAIDESDWETLISAAKQQTLSSAIISAVRSAHNDISAHKRSLNANFLRNYTIFGFEIDGDDVDDLLVILNAQALIHSVTGSNVAKFAGVLQAELRLAALSEGYTVNQTLNLHVQNVIATNRQSAIQQAQTYLANNTNIWYEA